MSDKQAAVATITGAVIGGIAGYFFFTEHGRELRRRFEPALDDWARELNSSRLTLQKAAGIAQESWKLLTEATDAGSSNMRYPSVNQTPF